MSKKVIFYTVVGLLIAVAIVIISQLPGSLTIELDKNSPLQTGVSVYTSIDGFKSAHNLPYHLEKVRAGKYQLVTVSDNGKAMARSFRVHALQPGIVKLSIDELPKTNEQTEITPTDQELANNPLFQQFPYKSQYYDIYAEFGRDASGQPDIQSIKIIVYLPPIFDGTPAQRQALINQYANDAKAWLTSQNISPSIPITVQDGPISQ